MILTPTSKPKSPATPPPTRCRRWKTSSRLTGIPVGSLIRYVLVKYAASSSDARMALLARDPIVFRQMREHVERAEEDGRDEAKLKAYAALKDMIAWLSVEP